LHIAQTHNITVHSNRLHELLSQVYEKSGDVAKALRHNRQFHEQKTQLDASMNTIHIQQLHFRFDIEKAERERELAELRATQLQLQLETKNAELNSSALALAKKNEAISLLLNSAIDVATLPPDKIQIGLEKLISDLDRQIRSDKDWKGLAKKLQYVQDDFINRLKVVAPSLSRTELNICSLLKLNLTSKEIADILFLSPQSVDVSRHRIRNKLKLGSGNLTSFLESL